MSTHKHDIRIYYEDTDAGGIVYYANYLKFCERARTEFLRSMGFSNTALKDEEHVLLVVRHVEADYRGSARLDDMITIKTTIDTIKNASFIMKQEICQQDKAIFIAKVVIACVNAINNEIKPTKIPEKLQQALQSICIKTT